MKIFAALVVIALTVAWVRYSGRAHHLTNLEMVAICSQPVVAGIASLFLRHRSTLAPYVVNICYILLLTAITWPEYESNMSYRVLFGAGLTSSLFVLMGLQIWPTEPRGNPT